MAETDNPDSPIVPPRTTRFGEGPEGKGGRRERGTGGGNQSLPSRIAQYFRDVRAEMKRVSWPTLNEVKNTTIITLVAVIFFSIYLFAIDQGLARLILGLDWLIEKIARFLGLA